MSEIQKPKQVRKKYIDRTEEKIKTNPDILKQFWNHRLNSHSGFPVEKVNETSSRYFHEESGVTYTEVSITTHFNG